MNRNILSLPRHDLSIPHPPSRTALPISVTEVITSSSAERGSRRQCRPPLRADPGSARTTPVKKGPCASDADDLERKRAWKLYENDSCCCDQNKHENGLSLPRTVFVGARPLSIS